MVYKISYHPPAFDTLAIALHSVYIARFSMDTSVRVIVEGLSGLSLHISLWYTLPVERDKIPSGSIPQMKTV